MFFGDTITHSIQVLGVRGSRRFKSIRCLGKVCKLERTLGSRTSYDGSWKPSGRGDIEVFSKSDYLTYYLVEMA